MKNALIPMLLFVCVAPRLTVADRPLTHVDVFTAGKEGYDTYRIPAIETAPDGSLIAVAEARKYNASDPGMNNNDIDLVIKRSTDDGRTWSRLIVIDDPGERWSACNPATLFDRATGRIWLLHARTKPGRSSITSRAGTDDVQAWVRSSGDNGVTWSEPTDITSVARDVEHWGCSVFGPGGAIQDRKGRLIAPLCRTTSKRNAANEVVPGTWRAFVIFSDDHGRTWQRGQLLPAGSLGNESQLVELTDGSILMDSRQNKGPHRQTAISRDGGMTWSNLRPSHAVTPVACAIERYTLKSAGDDHDRIVWIGPKGPRRANLVVRVSYDEGQSYTGECDIAEEPAAYSDLTILKDKTVGALWERGGYKFITFSRFGLDFLEP